MADTLNEALGNIAPDDGSGTPITVSSDLRTLTIPANVTMIGIVTDEKTNIIHFRVPRYSKTFDLSAFSISIIYKNALGNTYYHPVAQNEISLTEDFISFFWIPERAVYVAAGTITIALDFKLYENGEVSREWNTTTGALQVHDTLKDGAEEVVVEQPETIYSIVNEYLETLDISGGGSGSQGPKGDTGDKGDKGEDGEDGKSAYELAVQNGFSGTLTEWLNSLKGAKGDKGDKGDTGEQGIQGTAGSKGDKGDTGDSGVEQQITISTAVSTYTIKPNILYVFPEEAALTITFDETGINTSVVNDYHFTFVNGSTACELELPETVNVGDLDIQPNTVCEISIVNNLLSFQNWSTV